MIHYFLWGSKYKVKRTTIRTKPFLSYVVHLKGFSPFYTKFFAHKWITIANIKFSPFLLKHTLYALVIFLGFGTCFERHLHYAILQVCLFIVECSLFIIHYLMQLLDFVEMEFGVGFWVSLGVSKIHIG